jgi:hypothetical protein
MQLVIRLLEPGDHVEAHGKVLLEFGAGFPGRDFTAQLALAGEGQFLRNHDTGIAGDLAAQPGHGVRSANRRIAQRDSGVVQAACLAGPLPRSFVLLLRRQNLTVIAQRFGH